LEGLKEGRFAENFESRFKSVLGLVFRTSYFVDRVWRCKGWKVG